MAPPGPSCGCSTTPGTRRPRPCAALRNGLAATTFASGLTYDLFGRLTAWTDGLGLVHAATYDTTGSANFRLQQLKVTWYSSVWQQFDYTVYDAGGNLVQMVDNTPYATSTKLMNLPNSWTYAYDGVGRLHSAQPGAATPVSFAYDGLGNMTAGNQMSFAYADAPHPHHVSSVAMLLGVGLLCVPGRVRRWANGLRA